MTAVLGLDDESGKPLLLPLPDDRVAHVLVAGTSGSGKTSLIRCMALSLARYNRPRDLQMIVIDHKRKLEVLGGLPHLMIPPVVEQDAIGTVMSRLVTLLDQRISGKVARKPTIVVFVDELSDLLSISSTEMEHAVQRLTSQGRSESIHLVIAAQNPLAKDINSTVKANAMRVVFRVTDASKASVAAGIPDTGAELLAGRGDGLLIFCGNPIRFQAGWISEEDTKDEVLRMGNGHGHTPITVDGNWKDTLRATMNIAKPSGGARRKPIPQEYVDAIVAYWLKEHKRIGRTVQAAKPSLNHVSGSIHYHLYQRGTNKNRGAEALEMAEREVMKRAGH